MPTEILDLLVSPRENLRVFRHLAEKGSGHPRATAKALGIGINTWYAALRQLEGLDLIAVERAPGGRKVRHVALTPAGERFREVMARCEELLRDSPAALRLELEESPPPKGSARAGVVLCMLIEAGERRMDWGSIEEAGQTAGRLGRPAEEHLARGVLAFFQGEAGQAERETKRAMELLEHHEDVRTHRKALWTHALALELLERGKQAFQELLELRKLARGANDPAMEASAYQAMGILKGRRAQFVDSVRYLERGASVAHKAGLKAIEARLLYNLGFSHFFVDLDRAIEANDGAIEAAAASGARLTLAHGHLNRALYMAAKGKRPEALASLRRATAEYKRGGEERGPEAHRDFVDLVKRTLRSRPPHSLQDLRDQALQSTRLQPLPPRAGR